MIFRRVNRTAPEQVFGTFQANDANCLKDVPVALESTAASVDGVKVVRPPTAIEANHTMVGIVDASISNGDFGLVQVYGYRSTSTILSTNTSIAIGAALAAASATNYLSSIASTVGVVPFAAVLESSTSSSGTISRKIFIRGM